MWELFVADFVTNIILINMGLGSRAPMAGFGGLILHVDSALEQLERMGILK